MWGKINAVEGGLVESPTVRDFLTRPNPERAETRSCPRRPPLHRGGSASKKGTWPPLSILLRPRVAQAQNHTGFLNLFFSLLGGGLVEPPTARVQRGSSETALREQRGLTRPPPSPLTALSSGSYNSRYGLGRNALIQVAQTIHECRREAFETEARRGFSQVRPT